MAGTKAGGAKCAATNKAKYGPDFYSRIGKEGGKSSGTGGFAYAKRIGNDAFIREAGRRGGATSKRRWTAEERARHGELIRQAHAERRAEKIATADSLITRFQSLFHSKQYEND